MLQSRVHIVVVREIRAKIGLGRRCVESIVEYDQRQSIVSKYDTQTLTHSSGSLLYIMHGLSLFWLFTSIIFVLEIFTLNLVCMQIFSNAFISFCASPKVFAKSATSSAYSKSIMTTFPMTTSSTHSSLQTW